MVALGYPVYRLKLAGFAAAGSVAGLAGGLLASHNAFVSPATMHWTQSALLLVMVMLGGAGRRWGAALGVALWLTLEEVLKMYTDYWHWPLGVLLLLVVFHAPQGVTALFDRRGEQGAAR
jgi:branched-chain amino acid transport system permease protein